MRQPSESAKINSLLSKLSKILESHPYNLSLIESKSRQDLYSDISCFLQHNYDRDLFFKMEKTDLFDFLLIALYMKRLLGFWICLGFLGKKQLAIPDPDLIQEISNMQESEYNQNKIIQDFPLLSRFIEFKKTRVRLTSFSGGIKNMGGVYFEEHQNQLGYLLESDIINKWFSHYQEHKLNTSEEKSFSNLQIDSRESFSRTESFYKFSSEYGK